MAAGRDAAEVHRACERFLDGHRPASRSPKATLERLAAAIGDDDMPDMYGRGELVERLEARVADLLGKQAAVVMPTGTMAQQIALRIHAGQRGVSTIAFHPTAHVELHEEGAYERLHGLHSVLVGRRHAVIELADLEGVHEPLAALLLELPQREIGGRLREWEELEAQARWAHERGVALHLDGARLWEAGPYYDRPHAEIAALFDTVYVSFYKGLGAIAGCALAGDDAVVSEARVWQIRHGGRLASFDAIAVSAWLGLDRALPQMPARHRKAVEIGRALAAVEGIDVVPWPPQTPMMHLFLRGDRERLEQAALEVAAERRVWLFRRPVASQLPGVQKVELTIAEPGLELDGDEVGELFADLLARAAP